MTRPDPTWEHGLPRDRNEPGAANEAQYHAAEVWSSRMRKTHRHESRQDRWDRWEIQNENERWGRS